MMKIVVRQTCDISMAYIFRAASRSIWNLQRLFPRPINNLFTVMREGFWTEISISAQLSNLARGEGSDCSYACGPFSGHGPQSASRFGLTIWGIGNQSKSREFLETRGNAHVQSDRPYPRHRDPLSRARVRLLGKGFFARAKLL
jgi:hypothetical protein